MYKLTGWTRPTIRLTSPLTKTTFAINRLASSSTTFGHLSIIISMRAPQINAVGGHLKDSPQCEERGKHPPQFMSATGKYTTFPLGLKLLWPAELHNSKYMFY